MPPAARITDMHVCPMVNPGPTPHVGGPIAMGAPTVFTGKLPQARVGDMAICIGPPDTIAKGSSGVFVTKRPAARMGDSTAHGGVIVAGLPTVIIGETGGGGSGGGGVSAGVGGNGFVGGGAPALAYAQAPTMAAAMKAAAASGTPFCELCFQNSLRKTSPLVAAAMAKPVAPTQPPLSPECAKLARARDHAQLADDAYHPGQSPPPGYAHLDPNSPAGQTELRKLGISPSALAPADSDFRAAVYKNGQDYVVSYRGTQSGQDWVQNLKQGSGFESAHYEQAMALAKQAKRGAQAQNGSVSFVGHSLGGGMASAAAVATNSPATTFNAAGLHANTVAKYDGAPPVDAYHVPGEALSLMQDNRVAVLGGLTRAASAVNTLLGAATVGWLAANEVAGTPILPKAYGNRHELPAATPAGKTMLERNPINRHGMDWVLHGIDTERSQKGCP
jgi:uncharacterized Zn-binding protein involved in type VI secretion